MRQRDKRRRERARQVAADDAVRGMLQNLGTALFGAVAYGAGYCDRCGRKASARCRETCVDPGELDDGARCEHCGAYPHDDGTPCPVRDASACPFHGKGDPTCNLYASPEREAQRTAILREARELDRAARRAGDLTR